MFDKNKIIMSEKLVKMPKLKKPEEKKTKKQSTAATSGLNVRPMLNSVQVVRRSSLARPSILSSSQRHRHHATASAGGAGASSLKTGPDEESIEYDTSILNEQLLNYELNNGHRPRRNRSNIEARRRHRKRSSKNTGFNNLDSKISHRQSNDNEILGENDVLNSDKRYEDLNMDFFKILNKSENNLAEVVSLKSAKEKQTKFKQSPHESDNEEPVYLKAENSKEDTNLNEPNMIALATSLPLNPSNFEIYF